MSARYDIVPETGELKRFPIVLSATEAGVHHLIIREGNKTVATSRSSTRIVKPIRI